jgi:hypothetical protein
VSTSYNLRMILENIADSATLSASPAMVVTLPEGNLQRQEGAYVARSTSLATQYINFDLAAERVHALDMFVLLGDFSADAIVTLTLYPQVAQAGTAVYSAGETVWRLLPWESFGPWGRYEWGGGAVFDVSGSVPASVLAPGDASEEYTTYISGTFKIEDPTNTNGYHNLKRLFIGQMLQPAINYDYGYTLSVVDDSTQEREEGGGLASFPVEKYRRLRFQLNHIDRTEWPSFWGGVLAAGKINDVYVDAKPLAAGVEHAAHQMRAKFTELPEFSEWAAGQFSASFELEEVK